MPNGEVRTVTYMKEAQILDEICVITQAIAWTFVCKIRIAKCKGVATHFWLGGTHFSGLFRVGSVEWHVFLWH